MVITNMLLPPKGVSSPLAQVPTMDDFDNEESIDALLQEALSEFEQCRMVLNKITGKKHVSVTISSSTPALEN